MSTDIIVTGLFGLSLFFIIISFFIPNASKRELEELKDYSFEQTQELYRLRERVSSLETYTGLPMTQTLSFTTEFRNLNELNKENVINLYREGKNPEEIALFANLPMETVQILIDRYIEESTK